MKPQKKSKAKRGMVNDVIHPKARKVKQASRFLLKREKLEEHRKERAKIDAARVQRMLWFKTEVDKMETTRVMTSEEVLDVVNRFLTRHDEELAKPLPPHIKEGSKTKHRMLLKTHWKQEHDEYKGQGLMIPDFESLPNIKAMQSWSCKGGGLTRISMLAYTLAGYVRPEVKTTGTIAADNDDDTAPMLV